MQDPRYILGLAALLGAVGLWLLLPRAAARGRGVGAVLAAAALGLVASQMPGLAQWPATTVFWTLAVATLVAAVAAISCRNPAYCAIWFGLALLGTAGLLLFLGAQFIAIATVAVYVGAILVTFLFVLLLAQPGGRAPYDRVSWESQLSAIVSMALTGVLTMAVITAVGIPPDGQIPAVPSQQQLATQVLAPDQVARLGGELFGRYLIAVEVAGILLLVALVGAAAVLSATRSPEGAPPTSA